MIKKSIPRILTLVMFFNSIGCYVSKSVKKEEYNKVSPGERIIMTMNDGKKHSIIIENIEEKNIHGKYTSRLRQGETIVIAVEDIKKIELRQSSTSKSILAILAIGGLMYLGSEMSKW